VDLYEGVQKDAVAVEPEEEEVVININFDEES